jgi:hypothetical protein
MRKDKREILGIAHFIIIIIQILFNYQLILINNLMLVNHRQSPGAGQPIHNVLTLLVLYNK